jgi:hypothetical protein
MVHNKPQNINDTVFTLASRLEVNVDEVRREHFLLLYRLGMDLAAAENISRITNLDLCRDQLIEIARARLGFIIQKIKSSKKDVQLLSLISQDLVKWANASGSAASTNKTKEPVVSRVTLISTHRLLLLLIQRNLIPETHTSRKMIDLALTTCLNLMQHIPSSQQ